ncbi:MAG: hypothetical protein AB7E81_03290 [Hyphomicrobiaceae bacterium]
MVHRLQERHEGAGFFVGGLLLDWLGFRPALWLMTALIGLIFALGVILLPRQLGKAKSSKSVKELFAKSRAVNLLAAARVFLFGARDIWFVVGLPVFFYANGWRFWSRTGRCAAARVAQRGWAEGRGSGSARLGSRSDRHPGRARNPARERKRRATGRTPRRWSCDLRAALCGELIASLVSDPCLCGLREAAEDVGFYYAANALGRLMGILLSGALYQTGGMIACLAGSAAMLVACWVVTLMLPIVTSARAMPDQPAKA